MGITTGCTCLFSSAGAAKSEQTKGHREGAPRKAKAKRSLPVKLLSPWGLFGSSHSEPTLTIALHFDLRLQESVLTH
ncbi:MAG: hypothetical protein B6A08_08665 [Sorangiineae bacterium NIC37A_2]|nr:MAG: hypothetical protein B6A08_08665 [Sorangiineae bacterium NIC37A_2]